MVVAVRMEVVMVPVAVAAAALHTVQLMVVVAMVVAVALVQVMAVAVAVVDTTTVVRRPSHITPAAARLARRRSCVNVRLAIPVDSVSRVIHAIPIRARTVDNVCHKAARSYVNVHLASQAKSS